MRTLPIPKLKLEKLPFVRSVQNSFSLISKFGSFVWSAQAKDDPKASKLFEAISNNFKKIQKPYNYLTIIC